MIVISYCTREFAHRCTKLEIAQKWLGPINAQALIDLIADAEALENAQALIDFYGAKIEEGGFLLIRFSPQFKATLKPIGPKMPRTAGGTPAWELVRRLMLVEVEEG